MRALEALADELAHARAEARQHCAAAERARSAAQRLGQARTVGLDCRGVHAHAAASSMHIACTDFAAPSRPGSRCP